MFGHEWPLIWGREQGLRRTGERKAPGLRRSILMCAHCADRSTISNNGGSGWKRTPCIGSSDKSRPASIALRYRPRISWKLAPYVSLKSAPRSPRCYNASRFPGSLVTAPKRARATILHAAGIGVADAAHVAFAEQMANCLMTCDDALLKRCRRIGVNIAVMNPIELVANEVTP